MNSFERVRPKVSEEIDGAVRNYVKGLPYKRLDLPGGIVLDRNTFQPSLLPIHENKEKGTLVQRLMHPTRGGASNYNLVLKTYTKGRNLNIRNIRREASVTGHLSRLTDRLVRVYDAEERQDNFFILMEDLGKATLGVLYRGLDERELDRLNRIFLEGESGWLPEEDKERYVLESLSSLELAMKNHVNGHWLVDQTEPKIAEARFELDRSGKLKEKSEFKEERLKAFESALETIVGFDTTVTRRPSVTKQFPNPNDDPGKRINRWFENWFKVAEINGTSYRIHNAKLASLKTIYYKEIDEIISRARFPGGLILGNPKPMNFSCVSRDGEPVSVAMDLFRMKLGRPRIFRDAVSLLEVGRLTCDLTGDAYLECYHHLADQVIHYSNFGERRGRELVQKFEDYKNYLIFERLFPYYASACKDVVYNMGTPTPTSRKQAEFVIDAGRDLFVLIKDGLKVSTQFKLNFLPYLLLSDKFKQFAEVANLPDSYIDRIDQQNDQLRTYVHELMNHLKRDTT